MRVNTYVYTHIPITRYGVVATYLRVSTDFRFCLGEENVPVVPCDHHWVDLTRRIGIWTRREALSGAAFPGVIRGSEKYRRLFRKLRVLRDVGKRSEA